MFIFEDLIHIEPRMLQIILREMSAQELAVAMKGASGSLRELILKNVSENFAKAIKEEIDLLGPVRVSMVEEAQQKITGTVRRLADEGVITIQRGEQDEAFI